MPIWYLPHRDSCPSFKSIGLATLIFCLAGCEGSSYPGALNPRIEEPEVVTTPSPAATPAPIPSPTFPVTETEKWFNEVMLRPEWIPRLDVIVAGIVRDKERYLAVEKMRPNGMPWYFVGGIHERESSRNFTRHLHEGSPLIHRTQFVPKNRLPPPKDPPYTFSESAEDALYVLKHEDRVPWNDTRIALDALEAYNGLGYRKYHPDVFSPYLWSGTGAYSRGKYIADGRFSSTTVDQQAGVAALWLRLRQRELIQDKK
jgi:lysozyme family protein